MTSLQWQTLASADDLKRSRNLFFVYHACTTFDLALFTLLVFMTGISISGFNGIWMNIVIESVEKSYAGIVSSLSITIGSIGVVAGPPLFGIILELTSSYRAAWFFSTFSILIAAILLILSRNAYKTAGIKV